IVAIVTLAFWAPPLLEIYTVPKQSLTAAFGPIVDQGRPGDGIVLVPEWNWCLDWWYAFGAAQPAEPPKEARYGGMGAEGIPGGGRRPYTIDLEAAIASGDPAKLPPAVWVVLFDDPP